MNLMSPDIADSHGARLTRFLEKEWDAMHTTRAAWCRKAGLADSTVLRWERGVEPDMRNLQLVADGLDRKLIEVLYHAGYIDEADMRLRTIPAPRERVDLEVAIRTDRTLDDTSREALLAIHAALTRSPASPGRKRTIRVTGKN